MSTPAILLILLIILCVVALTAQRFRIAPPIAFLLTGTLLGFVPGMPHVAIRPEYMLVIFLPPLLMEVAYFTSLRDFMLNLRAILQLAVGLVVATSAAVAFVFMQLVPGVNWALGFVLGAIVSPPDAVAATSIIKHMRIPKRIVTIIEGESLINDATGLVLYQFAVAAVVTGALSLASASLLFMWKAIAGIALGIMLGRVFMDIFPRIRDISVEILSTFLVAFASYVMAETIHASGVLAVVATGLTVGWLAPERFSPRFRLQSEAVWHMVTFALNGVIFLLIGLQLPLVLQNLAASNYDPSTLFMLASSICGVVVLVRMVWVFAFSYASRFLFPVRGRKRTYPTWQNVFVVAWTGMRGVVSLATALALPLTLADGTAFPHRDLIIFLGVSVIFFTLVVQGLPLPWMLRKLPLTYNPAKLYEEWNARVQAAKRALARIDELAVSGTIHGPALTRLRSHYEDRLAALGDGPNTPLGTTEAPITGEHPYIQAENRLWQEVLDVERRTLIALRKSFEIGDDVMHDILRDIDLVASRFQAEPQP